MATVLGGIHVAIAQLLHIILGAKHTRDNNLVKGDALDGKRIEKCLADVLKQHRGSRNEIGNTVVELVDMKIRIGPYKDEFLLALLRLLAVLNERDTVFLGCHHLHTVAVGEGGLECGNTKNPVFHKCTVGIIPLG